ncbi:hypothetical protein AB1Y20_003329 [Prymnesium parvum]|uniref:J domain-containing protein n=1 Tax=Prymnesium parvum TaxID=97485 RepID=A0AB34JE67_PRYPA
MEDLLVDRLLSLANASFYEILGVQMSDPIGIIKQAYFKMSRKVHPDKCQHSRSTEAFQLVQAAWSTLSDPALSAAYRNKFTARYKPTPAPRAAPASAPSQAPSSASVEAIIAVHRALRYASLPELRAISRKLGLPAAKKKVVLAQSIAVALSAYGCVETSAAKAQRLLAEARTFLECEFSVCRAEVTPAWHSLGDLRMLVASARSCGLTTLTHPVLQRILQRIKELEEQEARSASAWDNPELRRQAEEENARQQAVERSRREAEEERSRRRAEAMRTANASAAGNTAANAAAKGAASMPHARQAPTGHTPGEKAKDASKENASSPRTDVNMSKEERQGLKRGRHYTSWDMYNDSKHGRKQLGIASFLRPVSQN